MIPALWDDEPLASESQSRIIRDKATRDVLAIIHPCHPTHDERADFIALVVAAPELLDALEDAIEFIPTSGDRRARAIAAVEVARRRPGLGPVPTRRKT